jgi:hypothetical protein
VATVTVPSPAQSSADCHGEDNCHNPIRGSNQTGHGGLQSRVRDKARFDDDPYRRKTRDAR